MEICNEISTDKITKTAQKGTEEPTYITIKEGQVEVITLGNVFYNPVQQFNRDLSISVLSVFSNEYEVTKAILKNKKNNTSLRSGEENKNKYNEDNQDSEVNVIINAPISIQEIQAGVKSENGITILEALSATGLRSIRYAKEIPGVQSIISNDLSIKAVKNINDNIVKNKVEDLVTSNLGDAVLLMQHHKQPSKRFSAVDLDPYGCPSIFLDSAVQCVEDGGLLLVTATDMAVLAGNSPETCYSKYGAISLRLKCCHEMALRILLQCIESHANRYSRYIVPQLSISADFYIRVFVKIYTGAAQCKASTSKLSMIYACTGCESFTLHPLGILKTSRDNYLKYSLPIGLPVGGTCSHCNSKFRVGGPIWSAPIHNMEFVNKILATAPQYLETWKRIQGVLNVISEELVDVPLYYTLERLSSILHIETPPMLMFRSAILNAGYHVSFSHAHKSSIKTDAPMNIIWDIFRYWETMHPIKREKYTSDSPVIVILSKESVHEKDIKWLIHPEANPQSRKSGFVRFQENPASHWGPGTKSTAMVNNKNSKSIQNQGKYTIRNSKRQHSEESDEEKGSKIKIEEHNL